MDVKRMGLNRRDVLVAAGAGVVALGVMSKTIAAHAESNPASDLERSVEALRRALVDGDGDALTKLVHDQMTYSHSDGRVWTKHDLLQNIAGKKRYLSIAVSNQTVEIVKPTGIVRHTYDVVNNLGDGKTGSSHIAVLMCWVRSDNGWQLLARSGTTLPA
jgi:Domain of unknown function (DUF4440)